MVTGVLARPALVVQLSLSNLFLPINKLWWFLLGAPLLTGLHALTAFLAGYPIALAIGPFGLAVILMTVAIRLVLLPAAVYQLRAARRASHEAARIKGMIGSELDDLREEYAKDPAALNRERALLYQRHGINPLSTARAGLKGVLVAGIVQAPILIAFYSAIRLFSAPTSTGGSLHFLWVHSLAMADPFLILPIAAAITSYALSRVTAATNKPGGPTDDAAAAAQRQAAILMTIVVGVSAYLAPAALVLYWVTGNLIAIFQQLLLAPRILH
jgi:YidC/Oxa1 family membrane protein insertase